MNDKMFDTLFSKNPRSIERIHSFMTELEDMWLKYPDMRFGQLIYNFEHWYQPRYFKDIFQLEENDFIKYFREYMGDE